MTAFTKIVSNKNRIALLTIVLTILTAHGLLLLNDGIYWDDWVWFDLRTDSYHWDRVYAAAKEMGSMPYEKYLSWLYYLMPNRLFASRLLVFLSILVVGIISYRLCYESGVFNRIESLLAALLAVTFPAYKTQVAMSTAFYMFYLALFFAAVYLIWQLEKPGAAPHRRLIYVSFRILALVVFFFCFSLNSLLVLFYAFLALLFLLINRPDRGNIICQGIAFLHRYPDLVLLPLVFWLIKKTFFNPSGLYLDYNEFILSGQLIIQSVKNFLVLGVLGPFQILAGLIRKKILADFVFPGYLYVLFPLLFSSIFYYLQPRPFLGHTRRFTLFGGVAAGLILLASAIFPYVVTGHSTKLYGWDTRNAILLGFPVGILIIACLRWVFRTSQNEISLPGIILAAGLVIGFIFLNIQSYVQWEVRWIKDQSVMNKLAQIPNIEKISVYQVNNEYETLDNESYQFYEWSGLFYYAFGTEQTVGLDLRDHKVPDEFLTGYGKQFMIERYNLRDFDPHGCQASLEIDQGPYTTQHTSTRLFIQYYWDKITRHSEKLQALLNEVTTLRLETVRSPVATHCRALPTLPLVK